MSADGPGAATVDVEVATSLRRAALYRLLGAAFAYPGPERCAEIARLASALGVALPADDPIAGPLAELGAAARGADPVAVAEEHVFLFDRQVRCSPHEGAYGDGPQLAGKGAQLADVAGFYAAFGLTPAGGEPDVEDHIVAELEFMSVLALKEAWALAEAERDGLLVTRRAQAAFLADHLGRWTSAFADELGAATPLPYYGAAATLLGAWVERECKRLGVEPGRVAGRLGQDPMQAESFTCPMAGDEEGTRDEEGTEASH
jgi:TorA maturation chaperone TorD